MTWKKARVHRTEKDRSGCSISVATSLAADMLTETATKSPGAGKIYRVTTLDKGMICGPHTTDPDVPFSKYNHLGAGVLLTFL